ncbi:MAG TPA: hypothetical protein VNA30_05630 [Mycobacteriales bacterium]|nr:hypothetical protein [Mycobacteriales bacterium]
MSRRLISALTVLGVSVALVGGAAAAPKKKPAPKPLPPACNLVVDEAGDTASAPFPASDTIDIKSADVASDGVTVTAVLRVFKYTENDPGTIYGKRYIIAFEGAGLKPMYLRALDYPGNVAPAAVRDQVALPFDFGTTEVNATTGQTQYASKGPATGTINASTGEITVSAKAADFDAAGFGKLAKGGIIKNINAVTFRRVGNQLYDGDTASSRKTYVVGQASCVKVG